MPTPTPETASLLVAVILFASTLCRATFGFGDALIAMPLLALVLGVNAAAPLVALVSVTIAGLIVVKDWRQVHARSAWLLIGSSLPGIPAGIYLLSAAPPQAVKAVLGAIVARFAFYRLVQPRLIELRTDRWACAFGALAGVLGGAYNAPGPPLVIYGALRRWTAREFRATLQAYFLPTSVLIVVAHGFRGSLTPLVLSRFVASLPLVFGAILIGAVINRRLRDDRFIRYVYVLLCLLGLLLLADAAASAL